jgi:hypothetical protein
MREIFFAATSLAHSQAGITAALAKALADSFLFLLSLTQWTFPASKLLMSFR